MFTALAFGLCALVIEGPEDHPLRLLDLEYPVVGIGVLYRDQCRATLFLAANNHGQAIPIRGQLHQFRVEKINESSVVLWIDEKSFLVPRPSF
jgi:hypothetical protein